MRAEKAAALATFVLILLVALGLMLAGLSSDNGSGTVVYAYPVKHAIKTVAAVILGLLFVAPLAAVASWRTFIHAQRVVAKQSRGWRGIVEAGAFGFLLTLSFVLPIVVGRMFVPEPWSRGEALGLGAAYLIAYGGVGAVIGLALGCASWATASLVLRLASKQQPSSDL